MGLRRQSIRLRIVLLVAIPILSLIGVYAFAATITATNAINLARSRTLKDTIGTPTGNLEAQIDVERLLAVAYLAAPVPSNLATLRTQETRTEVTQRAFGNAAAATMGDASRAEGQAIDGLLRAVAGLGRLRAQIASQAISRPQAIGAYGDIIADADAVLSQAILQENNVTLATQSLALVRIGQSEETLLDEDALIDGDAVAGTFSAADRQQFTELAGARRAIYAQGLADLEPFYRAYYQRDISPQAAAALEALENKVIADSHAGRVPPVALPDWNLAVAAVSGGISDASVQAATELTARAQPVANATFLRLYLVGGLGLLAVLLSIGMSVWIGRGLVQQLAALRRSALDLAGDRLPSVMARLRAGQDVDVAAEAPPLDTSSDEIGQVREAFNAVQRTAVAAAADEARLRRGVSDVFRNLARRSQSLLHRQLALLDAMERRASGPEELEDLFRIDHLTTRMRRHSESLIILSGESPARGWRHPVPFIDVLRAAVAEVEDYPRIQVTVGTPASLIGPAVADVIHMLAELAENATIYSPPNAPVRVHGDVVGRGFAIEIEDRGLGIGEEKLAEINNNFAHPPEFDLSGSEQLGLFVAGQLAKRHDIRITLQASPFGGTTAIVLIPTSLLAGQGSYAARLPAIVAGEGPIRLPSRPAILTQGVTAGRAALPRPSALAPSAPGEAPAAAAAAATATEPGNSGAEMPDPGLPGGDSGPFVVPAAPAVPAAPDTEAAGEEVSVFTPRRKAAGSAGSARSGLPVRVRQASLAPQLRDSGAGGDGDRDATSPSPEAARSVMTALQRGWERGRYVSGSVTPPPDTTFDPREQANGGEQLNDQ
jgi:signal transduction histidine kinase